jgi:hypothetical protein
MIKFMLKTHFNIFSSNVFLASKIKNFENMFWIRVIHFYLVKKCINNMYDIWSNYNLKNYIKFTMLNWAWILKN